jgi:23S rRNA pseudouridine2605 synthase
VLELPATGWLRRYRVRAHGKVNQAQLDQLRSGLTLSGIHYGAIEATIERVQGANLWLTFAIREGKNREVRNVLGHLGLDVTRLIRVSFGPFQLAELKAGEVEEIRTRTLREQLGEQLVAESGVDFSMPLLPQSPTPNKDPRRETTPRKPPSHSWRAHEEERPGKKFQRKFHGARRDDETPRQRPADDARAEVLTDRKGRSVPVERHGQPPPHEPPQQQPEKRGKHGLRRSSPDRASGPRRSHPKGRR